MNFDIRRDNKNYLDPKQFNEVYGLVQEVPWLQKLLNKYLELYNFCTADEEIGLINYLLRNFKFVEYQELSSYIKDLVKYIINASNIKSDNTMIFTLSDNSKPDGSKMIVQLMKNKFPISANFGEYNFSTNITEVNNLKKNITNVFIVDDFIGTGNTVERKLKYVRKVLEKKQLTDINLFVIAVASMEFAKTKLDTLNIKYYAPLWLKRGISQMNDPIKEQKSKAIMNKLEEKLKQEYKNKKMPSLGYKQSESLFSIEDINIPNNVFPVFWWPLLKCGQERDPLFRRSLS